MKKEPTISGDDMDVLLESLDPFWSGMFPGDKENLLSIRREREASLEK